MTNTFSLLMLLLGCTGMTAWFLSRSSNRLRFLTIVASVTLFSWGTLAGIAPSPALSAPQSSQAPEAEQQLKATATSGKYIGLEYVQGSSSGQAQEDEAIIETITDMNEDLVVQSSNGSVFLSGEVEDRQSARSLVDEIKEIPGVVQISYELGLE